MRKNLVLNNANIEGKNFYRSDNTCENAACISGIINISAGKEKRSSDTFNVRLLLKKPLVKSLLPVIYALVFAVKVIVLSTLSVTYFVIGGLAALLYLVLYDKLFKTLLISLETRKKKNPYYYKWKNHHLELNYEM